ncbi:MAG: hypothetical protein AVDCRST_MAG93-8120 [uncultured Chloroflexia bacterium]|uniref:Uncharacterized protein n=1 Tax=uncultured Chloroflexia bacterium TaxID=1672391 RepID=A0A6J4MVG7_9CHLR|nr:MAG: hypothetical protein AVDCRST_MAG93-8120 [uncultured Chloroflexia bacterium]
MPIKKRGSTYPCDSPFTDAKKEAAHTNVTASTRMRFATAVMQLLIQRYHTINRRVN